MSPLSVNSPAQVNCMEEICSIVVLFVYIGQVYISLAVLFLYKVNTNVLVPGFITQDEPVSKSDAHFFVRVVILFVPFVSVASPRRSESAKCCDPHLHGYRPLHVHATSSSLPQALQQEGRDRGTYRFMLLSFNIDIVYVVTFF